MKRNILIVGYGIVGNNLHKELNALEPDIADIKFSGHFKEKKYKEYDAIFICVDTPYVNRHNPCETSSIDSVIGEYSSYLRSDGVFVIKSTILPGTTEELSARYNYKIIFSPEYYGNTIYCNNFEFNFTILGGNKEDCIKVQQILLPCYDGRHTFHITDSKTAELVKYMENSYLAMMVSFCGQFYNLANDLKINYEELRELFIQDPRVNRSHTNIFRDHPYWDSHCLNKDLTALETAWDVPLIKSIIDFNKEQIRKYKI
jgi:nucleotide sugar dehydrogenase